MKILHLYYDLMNLYGENGNIRVLMRHLARSGAYTRLERKSGMKSTLQNMLLSTVAAEQA